MENFNKWNEVKKNTQLNKRKLGLKQRDIFWVKIGQNIGSEEYGKGDDFARPVIIINKLTSDLFLGIPMTTTTKSNDYFHSFKYNNKSKGIVENSAMILQLKTFSVKRVLSKIGVVNQEDFINITDKSKKLFNPIKKMGVPEGEL